MKRLLASLNSKRGQSLVEMAIMLPILLIILVGIVELGFALANQMTVTTAAREGARYGARFGPTNDTAVNDAILKVVTNTTSSLFSMDQAHADVIVIRAKTDGSGNIGSSTDFNADSYWVQDVLQDSPNIGGNIVTPAQIAQDLEHEPNLAVIIVQSFYDHRSVMGIPLVAVLSDRIPIGTYTVMRIEPSQVQAPCCLFPFAIPEPAVRDVGENGLFSGWLKSGEENGNFGWLRWNDEGGQGSAQQLLNRLQNPCEATSEYTNPDDESDHTIAEGKPMWGDSGISGSSEIRDELDKLCGAVDDNGNPLRETYCDLDTGGVKARHIAVPIYDTIEGTGSNLTYGINSFALIEIVDYHMPNNTEVRLQARLIQRYYTPCAPIP